MRKPLSSTRKLDLSDLVLDNLSPKREKVSHVLASDDEALPAVLLLGSKDVPRKNAAGRRRKLRQHGPAAALSSQASAALLWPRPLASRLLLASAASASISAWCYWLPLTLRSRRVRARLSTAFNQSPHATRPAAQPFRSSDGRRPVPSRQLMISTGRRLQGRYQRAHGFNQHLL